MPNSVQLIFSNTCSGHGTLPGALENLKTNEIWTPALWNFQFAGCEIHTWGATSKVEFRRRIESASFLEEVAFDGDLK